MNRHSVLLGLSLALLSAGCGELEVAGSGRPASSNATVGPVRAQALEPSALPPTLRPPSLPSMRQAAPRVDPVIAQSIDAAPAGEKGDAVFIGADAVTAGPGDTVYALSRRHRVSPRSIIEANDLKAPFQLQEGQRVRLPRARFHKVAKDETLYSISRRYKVDLYQLAKANGIGEPYGVYVGQQLRLPGAEKPTVAVATPPKRPALAPEVTSEAAAAVVTEPGRPLPPHKPERVAKAAPPASAPDAPRKVVPAPPARSGKGFSWPLKGNVISGYGPKAKGLHNDGINIKAASGTPIKAAENGVVAYAGNEIAGFGNLILVKHADGWVTAYAHADTLTVGRGDRVSRGQVIARVGRTGNVTEPQLHFEIRKGRRAVDPKRYLKG
ncbi:MAG: peptidoglycan DD-metalloendopeptidase family protein [Rhodospirillales bacterium]